MSTQIAGILVGADEVHVTLLTKEDDATLTVNDQTTLRLQTGARPQAYNILQRQFDDYVRQNNVECVCVKSSAVNRSGTKLAHLEAAELRGVIQSAAAGVCQVKLMNKAATSRTFGSRKVDEYLKDDEFWREQGLDDVKKGMRESAFIAISQFTD